jgi:acyl carrier protein
MQPPATSAPKPARTTDHEEALRHLPEEAREAFQRFRATGDVAALDPVILAILADFIPRQSDRPLAGLPAETRLMDDLGFDSLAITEVVFFTEDLFGISIANEEILQVRTLGDLRSFVHRKVAGQATG